MEKSTLIDFITRLGKSLLNQKPVADGAQKGVSDDETKVFGKAGTDKNARRREISTSEKAVVEMLRRHDERAKKIAERTEKSENGDDERPSF